MSDSAEKTARSAKLVTALALLAVVAGVALRFWLWSAHPPKALLMDEALYLRTAEWFYDTGEIDTVSRAPGYPVFVAAMYALLPTDLLSAAIYSQIALAGACTFMLYLLGRRACGPVAGLVAAWLFALDPTLAVYSLFAFVEPFYIFLSLLSTIWFLRALRRGSLADFGIAGLLLGAGTLTRGQTLLFAPLLAVWILFHKRFAESPSPQPSPLKGEGAKQEGSRNGTAIPSRRRVMMLGLFALTWAAVVLPWSFRNQAKFGHFILVDTTAARTLWHANHISYRVRYSWPFFTYLKEPGREPMPSEENDSAGVHGEILRSELRWMAEHPGLVLRRIPEKLGSLLNPTSFFQNHLARGEMAGWARTDRRTDQVGPAEFVSYLTTAVYAATLFLGVLGLIRGRRSNPLWVMAALQIGVTLALHAFFVSQSRYRLPMMPYVMLLAGAVCAAPWQHFHLRSVRTWLALVVIALLAWSWADYWDLVKLRPERVAAITVPRPERMTEGRCPPYSRWI